VKTLRIRTGAKAREPTKQTGGEGLMRRIETSPERPLPR
jgi:hypothetical protein